MAMMNRTDMALLDSKAAGNNLRRIARALAVIGLWSVFGFWYGTQVFVDMHARGMHHSFARIALWGVLNGWLWIPLMPMVFFVARRFPLEKGILTRSLAVHLVLFVALVILLNAGKTALTMLVRPFDPI